jgi:hypothetical protein
MRPLTMGSCDLSRSHVDFGHVNDFVQVVVSRKTATTNKPQITQTNQPQ